MNRRSFLTMLAAAPVLVDPEIWTPSRKIFLPPKGGWHGSGLTIEKIRKAKEMLMRQGMPDDFVFRVAFATGVGVSVSERFPTELDRRIDRDILRAFGAA